MASFSEQSCRILVWSGIRTVTRAYSRRTYHVPPRQALGAGQDDIGVQSDKRYLTSSVDACKVYAMSSLELSQNGVKTHCRLSKPLQSSLLLPWLYLHGNGRDRKRRISHENVNDCDRGCGLLVMVVSVVVSGGVVVVMRVCFVVMTSSTVLCFSPFVALVE
jgi:hypothetical protein